MAGFDLLDPSTWPKATPLQTLGAPPIAFDGRQLQSLPPPPIAQLDVPAEPAPGERPPLPEGYFYNEAGAIDAKFPEGLTNDERADWARTAGSRLSESDKQMLRVANAYKAPTPAPTAEVPEAAPSGPLSEEGQRQKDLAQIDWALATPENAAIFAVSQDRGNGFTANNKILQDYNSLHPVDFRKKYGDETYQKISATGIRGQEVDRLANSVRTPGEVAGDIGVEALNGFNQSLLGIADFGVRLGLPFSPETRANALNWLGEKSDYYNQNTRLLESDAMDDRRFVDSIRRSLDDMDNKAAAEADAADDTNFIDWLATEGRNLLRGGSSQFSRLLEDPTMLLAGSSEGIGSLATGGPISKTLSTVSKAGVLLKAERAAAPIAGSLADRVIDDALKDAAFPITIGAMEGGSNALQAQQEVMNIPEADLAQQPEYQRLIATGLTPEAARKQMAVRAGDTALVPSAVVGAVTGKLVEGIETRPLKSTFANPIQLGLNTAKETVEEGVQSAAGQASVNLGVKASGADPERDISAGVGDAAVEGAAAGAGTTLLTSTPGSAARLVADVTVGSAKAVTKAIVNRGTNLQAKAEAQSPVSEEQMAPSAQAAAESAPNVAADLQKMATEAGASGPDIDAYAAQIQAASQIQDEDLAIMPDQVAAIVADIKNETGVTANRFQALAIAAALAKDEEAPREERVAAATYIQKSIATNEKLFLEDFPEFLKNVPQDQPEFQSFVQYAGVLTAIKQTPSIKQAMDWANEQDLADVDLNTPTGAKIISNVVDVAGLAPDAVNPNVVDQILNQDAEGGAKLSIEQRRLLQGTKALKSAAATYTDNTVDVAGDTESTGLDFVNQQIEADGGSKGHQLSLVQHVKGISQAVAAKDANLVKQRVTKLNRFALSHRNKMAAINRSIETGEQNVRYTAADPEGKGYTPEKGVGVRIGNSGQEKFARTVHAEARSIAALSNEYAAQFPELNLPRVEVPDLLLDKKKGSPAPVAEAPTPSQATTAKTEEATVSDKPELPLQPSEPTRAPETDPPAVEAAAPVATSQTQNDVEPAAKVEVPAETVKQVSEPVSSAPEPEKDVAEPSDAEVVQLLESYDDPTPVTELKTSEAFPTLVQPAGKNFFHSSFKFPKVRTSRMLGVLAPLNEFVEALSSGRALRNFLGGQDITGYDVTAQDAAGMRELLGVGNNVLSAMKQRLREVVTAKRTFKKTGAARPSILEEINAGENVVRFEELRALNILEKTDKGYRYNQPLVETAIIAGLDWALNAGNRVATLNRTEVAAILGIDEDQVTDEHLDEMNRGVSLDVAARSLAQNIRKFWGVDAEKTEVADFVEGIPEALAKEILHGLESAGMLTTGNLAFPGLTLKTPGRVWFDERPEEVTDFIRGLDGVSDLLADMALIDREIEGYAFEPIKDVDQAQLRNRAVALSDQQKQALENTQAAPHHPNPLVFDFFEAMGLEQFVWLMSGRPYKNGDLNKSHTDMKLNKRDWDSIKGLQRGLVASYTNVAKQMAQVKKRGGGPVFYKHHINRLGRVQMDGLSNPQADKFGREIFMPTLSVLDLSNREGADFLKFAMTIGQGIGLKTEKLFRKEVVETVIADTMTEGGKLYPLVQALKTWLDKSDNSEGRDIPADVMQMLADAELSMHGIHSVLAVAKYELAKSKNEDLSQFETMTYLEADGKTNGPINALMLMASGDITAEWLQTIGKGGAYFGRLNKTLNSHVHDGTGEDQVDLYGAGATKTAAFVAQLGDDIQADSPEAFEFFESFQRFLAGLDLNVDLRDGELIIKRGLTKNPLTITIYGSGAAGIAGKVTDELLSAIYTTLSKSIETGKKPGDLIYGVGNDQTFMEDLSALTSRYINKNSDDKWFVGGKTVEVTGSLSDFELSTEQYVQLKSNIERMLIGPMRAAIDETVLKHVSPTTGAIQQATQLQSVFLKAMFIERIVARMALKQSDPEKYNYVKGQFLSEAELEDIRKSLDQFSPIISTGTQGYFLSGGERSDLFEKATIKVGDETFDVSMPASFSRSLTGDMQTPAFVYGSTLAGVKAIPTLVVGSGDGQMQLNLLSGNPEVAKRVEHVFDGVDLPADSIDEYSRIVNRSVFDTWTTNGNPVRAVYESFKAFMDREPIDVLFGEGSFNVQQDVARKEISETILGPKAVREGERVSLEDAKIFMETQLQLLKDRADEIDARRRTYAEFPMSVDQMASAESPYVNQGSIALDPNISYDDLAQAMNDRYKFHLAELRNEAQQAPVNEAIRDVGQVDEIGARVVEAADFPKLFKDLSSKLTAPQKEMMRAAAKLLTGSTYRIVFGSPSQLDAWEQTHNGDRYTPNTERAKIDPIAQVILVSSTDPESVVHELVHAATIDKVRAFYKDPNRLSPEERAAVQRIEGLMGEWLAMDPGDGASYEARQLAENAIAQHLDKARAAAKAKRSQADHKAAALNEFMAWVLSNQALARVAQKTKVKNSLWRIPAEVLAALKNLLWGASNKGPRVGDSILSNLRFNTRVLMAGPTSIDLLRQDSSAVMMFQSRSFGQNGRLSEIRSRLHNRIISWVKDDGSRGSNVSSRIRTAQVLDSKKLADQLTGVFAYHFPDLGSMQAKSTFTMIQLALMTEIELNSSALSRAEELYSAVVGQLKVEDFMENPNAVSPQDEDPNDRKQAQDKLATILGKNLTVTDPLGRSSLMSSFLALASTSEEFRKVLARLEKPKAEKSEAEGFDALLENAAMAGISRLGMLLVGENGEDANARDALDNLMYLLIEDVADQRTFIEQRAENGIDKVENYLAQQIQDKSAAIAEKSAEVARTSNNPIVKAGAVAVNVVATAINEEKADEAAKGLIHWLNNHEGWDSVKAVVADLVGRTDENAPIVDMIAKVRHTVSQVRQQFREDLPPKLNKMFKTAVSKTQWTSMFHVLGKTDLASLTSAYGLQDSLAMIQNDTARATEIARLEAGKDPRIQAKAKQLAHFMITGEHGVFLLRNAYSIVALGIPGAKNLEPDAQLVDEVDRLVTLYALNETKSADRTAVVDLIQNEKEGVEFVTSYLIGQRVDEIAKAVATPEARMNHYKGYIPSEANQGGSLIIASNTEHARLLSRGYTKLGAYTGSVADRNLGSRSYYFAPVTGRAPFSQGVLQTVHQTASGVDPNTGFTVGEVMAGRITDPREVRLAGQLLGGPNAAQTRENLIPVLDGQGRVTAFERAADPQRMLKLDKSTDLASMIGVWRGRQAEELLAREVNKTLIDKLDKIWKDGVKAGQQSQFVNIARLNPQTDDKVLIEAAKLIPAVDRAYIRQVFGKDTFMVRRDMLLDTFGARQASVGDLFTGHTRWNPKVVTEFEKIANGIFGGRKLLKEKSAYEILVGTEQRVQDVVSVVKTMIVVKSVIVPAANMVSNMFQLLNRGVPIRSIIHGMGAKTFEINTYVKNRAREVDLEAELRAAEAKRDSGTVLKLTNQIQGIRDGYKRMAIWPLIEAGEFSAISQGQVTAEDLSIANGGWMDWVEGKISQLKEPLKTPARYAMITRDTALYQGLARSVQYGDFVAKAILYDDLKGRKKKSSKEALAAISETFVNYNRLAGRGRQYLESVGLLWFYNYKLRIMKEAAHMLRHNPLRSLLVTAMPPLWLIGDIGTPVDDNILSVLNDGRLGYSIGPSMGMGAWHLSPWINIVH